MRYRAIVFDLFSTLVLFRPGVPARQAGGQSWRTTMEWLREAVERELPEHPLESFLEAVWQVTDEIVAGRPPEYHEVPSPERFRRAVRRLGVDGADAAAIGERLSTEHMRNLADSTWMPPAHGSLVADLAGIYRLGLVSNFDHGPTARRILRREEIDRYLDVTLVSDDFGTRKPHPSIFAAAVKQLGLRPEETLYVGDSLHDDVAGAHAAGLHVAWINRRGEQRSGPPPTYTLPDLTALREIVGPR